MLSNLSIVWAIIIAISKYISFNFSAISLKLLSSSINSKSTVSSELCSNINWITTEEFKGNNPMDAPNPIISPELKTILKSSYLNSSGLKNDAIFKFLFWEWWLFIFLLFFSFNILLSSSLSSINSLYVLKFMLLIKSINFVLMLSASKEFFKFIFVSVFT